MPYFNQNLGLKAGEDGQSIVLDTRDEHQVMPGTIHFAVLTTLAEVSAAQVAESAVVPASIHVNLLRRAQPGRLIGRGTLIRRGRKLVICEGEVFQDDRLVAKATIQFAVIG